VLGLGVYKHHGYKGCTVLYSSDESDEMIMCFLIVLLLFLDRF